MTAIKRENYFVENVKSVTLKSRYVTICHTARKSHLRIAICYSILYAKVPCYFNKSYIKTFCVKSKRWLSLLYRQKKCVFTWNFHKYLRPVIKTLSGICTAELNMTECNLRSNPTGILYYIRSTELNSYYNHGTA